MSFPTVEVIWEAQNWPSPGLALPVTERKGGLMSEIHLFFFWSLFFNLEKREWALANHDIFLLEKTCYDYLFLSPSPSPSLSLSSSTIVWIGNQKCDIVEYRSTDSVLRCITRPSLSSADESLTVKVQIVSIEKVSSSSNWEWQLRVFMPILERDIC